MMKKATIRSRTAILIKAVVPNKAAVAVEIPDKRQIPNQIALLVKSAATKDLIRIQNQSHKTIQSRQTQAPSTVS